MKILMDIYIYIYSNRYVAFVCLLYMEFNGIEKIMGTDGFMYV